MSAIDTTFGPIPGPLVKKWGRTVTFHKTGTTPTYNPTTGTVTTPTTTYSTKAVITRLTAAEVTGVLQTTDYKLLLAPTDLAGNTITTADTFTFTRGNRSIRAKIIEVTTYEGDAPVMFIVFVRPQ
jgi:hypothetical protein